MFVNVCSIARHVWKDLPSYIENGFGLIWSMEMKMYCVQMDERVKRYANLQIVCLCYILCDFCVQLIIILT